MKEQPKQFTLKKSLEKKESVQPMIQPTNVLQINQTNQLNKSNQNETNKEEKEKKEIKEINPPKETNQIKISNEKKPMKTNAQLSMKKFTFAKPSLKMKPLKERMQPSRAPSEQHQSSKQTSSSIDQLKDNSKNEMKKCSNELVEELNNVNLNEKVEEEKTVPKETKKEEIIKEIKKDNKLISNEIGVKKLSVNKFILSKSKEMIPKKIDSSENTTHHQTIQTKEINEQPSITTEIMNEFLSSNQMKENEEMKQTKLNEIKSTPNDEPKETKQQRTSNLHKDNQNESDEPPMKKPIKELKQPIKKPIEDPMKSFRLPNHQLQPFYTQFDDRIECLKRVCTIAQMMNFIPLNKELQSSRMIELPEIQQIQQPKTIDQMKWCVGHYSEKVNLLEKRMNFIEPFISTLSSKMMKEYNDIQSLKKKHWTTIDEQQKKLNALYDQLKASRKKIAMN